MKNSSTFKNIALIGLTLFSVYAILRFTNVIKSSGTSKQRMMLDSSRIQMASEPNCDPCTNRYSSPEDNGGMMITDQQFIDAASRYQDVNNPIEIRTRYVFVTKRAIDYMLNSNCKANGLNCYFGLNKTDKGNKLTLLLTAATSTHTDFDKTTNPTSIVFESDVLCPDECGSQDTIGNPRALMKLPNTIAQPARK